MEFEFVDAGSGPALLFLPGSYSTPAAWRGVRKALRGAYRLIGTSLPGYGASPEVRDADVEGMNLMVRFVEQVMARIGQPVHLVGHSFGGLTAFAAALDQLQGIESVITFEANPIYSRPARSDYPWLIDTKANKAKFEAAFAAGDPNAPSVIIDHWGGEGTFAAMPESVQAYCRSTARTNILDWRCAESFTPHISDYQRIDVPVTLVRGEHANSSIIDISADITAVINTSALRVVDNAGHFLIISHPTECAALIDEHMRQFG